MHAASECVDCYISSHLVLPECIERISGHHSVLSDVTDLEQLEGRGVRKAMTLSLPLPLISALTLPCPIETGGNDSTILTSYRYINKENQDRKARRAWFLLLLRKDRRGELASWRDGFNSTSGGKERKLTSKCL